MERKLTSIDIDLKGRLERGELQLPKYPVLKVWELPGTPGERDAQYRPRLPAEISRYIPDHYQVVEIEEKGLEIPDQMVDPLQVCMLATSAASPAEIGQHGAPAASVNPLPNSTERPRFDAPHGRDGEQVANDLYEDFPALTDATILKMFETQGVYDEENQADQPFGQEQVGSTILVDMPDDDPVAQKFTLIGGWRYPRYTSADATGSLISLLARRWRQDPSYLFRHAYNARDGQSYAYTRGFERARQWLADRTDESPDGLVEYRHHPYGGMRNQGWRDAANSILHSDGSWANSREGVATIDVQAISFDALLDAAEISLMAYDDKTMHDELVARALQIRDFILQHGLYDGRLVSGFDKDDQRNTRAIRPMTSAAGRALGSRMFLSNDPEIQEIVRQNIRALMAPDMLTRWGIRTMSDQEAGYVPFGYHNGSIWIHDTNEIAANLGRHQYHGLDRIIGATTTNQHEHSRRLLEHARGDDTEELQISTRNTYVYEPVEDELFLIEQVPADTTWSGSTTYAKERRYRIQPTHAIDPLKLQFERSIWNSLPDHIQEVVRRYQPGTAAALSR